MTLDSPLFLLAVIVLVVLIVRELVLLRRDIRAEERALVRSARREVRE